MDKNFHYKLTGILISFMLLLSLIIVIADYIKLKRNVTANLETQIQMAEDEIITSLSTIDKVYNILDIETAERMEEYSNSLLELYEKNPDFSKWNFPALKEESGMDVFIINAENQVIESSYEADVGMDFNECCKNFGALLTERRKLGLFSHDDLDLHQKTGEFKKFSYMPTPDHNYLIELAYYLEDQLVFKEFNFFDTTHRLVEENKQIQSISVYTSLGLLLGDRNSGKDHKINPSRKKIFNQAFKEFETKELTVNENGQTLTYRYIPYKADEEAGLSTNRVVEIAYYDVPFGSVLASYKKQFIFEMLVISVITVILAAVIARMASRPVYLAFHDVLTGLKNRAAFEDTALHWLGRRKGTLLFMMIDLDNFKQVNDSLGHGEGDRLLIQAANIIEKVSGKGHLAARIGGDEFVVLFSHMTEDQVIEKADSILEEMRRAFSYLYKEDINLSVSIGIAVADERDTINTLYNKADAALYQSKKKGKDQYSVYDGIEA